MRSAWRHRRKSIITLEDAVFKDRRPCQKCGEKRFQSAEPRPPAPVPEPTPIPPNQVPPGLDNDPEDVPVG